MCFEELRTVAAVIWIYKVILIQLQLCVSSSRCSKVGFCLDILLDKGPYEAFWSHLKPSEADFFTGHCWAQRQIRPTVRSQATLLCIHAVMPQTRWQSRSDCSCHFCFLADEHRSTGQGICSALFSRTNSNPAIRLVLARWLADIVAGKSLEAHKMVIHRTMDCSSSC